MIDTVKVSNSIDFLIKKYESDFLRADNNFDQAFLKGKVTAALEIQIGILTLKNKGVS